uniref:Polycystin cation channel PKD1/PKD2 domain-containing protein n=1 Tax=Electrophorus electricus TaxID=8005 RepID=A0A4W4DMJ9_ELEEL
MSEQEVLVNSGSSGNVSTLSWLAKADLDCQTVEELRGKLKYFFMSPCEKYQARGRKPWKMMLQFVKIIIITVQLVSFGLSNEMMVTFKEENLLAFKHLFLKDYKDRGSTYAVYTKHEVHDHIDHIIMRYLNLQNVTVGNHAFETVNGVVTPLSLCQEFYRHGNISPENDSFDIDPHVEKECIYIYPMNSMEYEVFPNDANFTLHFKRLLSVNIYLKVKAINLQTVRHDELPDCYNFSIVIEFDNRAHSGRIKVSLNSNAEIKVCKEWTVSNSSDHFLLIVLFDSLVIVVCLLSLVLCTRSVCASVRLLLEYVWFISEHHGTVSWSDRMQFVNGWHILIILSDVLTITGSVLKICIQSKELTNYNVCSILLGTSTILVWTGVMRYLGFIKKYNILILTLKAALPNVMRFSTCAVLIYVSYCFCGWIVLGPHHENFRSFNTVAYCLFSMINGDEIYLTFSKLRERGSMVWLFSRVYIYSFISIFTYMVLSLFIAIITETYETIKVRMPEQRRCTDRLQAFITTCKNHPTFGTYKLDQEPSSYL